MAYESRFLGTDKLAHSNSETESAELLQLVIRVRLAVEQKVEPTLLLDLAAELSHFSEKSVESDYEKALHYLFHVLSDQDIALSFPEYRAKELSELLGLEVRLRKDDEIVPNSAAGTPSIEIN